MSETMDNKGQAIAWALGVLFIIALFFILANWINPEKGQVAVQTVANVSKAVRGMG
ncbi:Uncharacterised protein [uncultured archaeon]|nr:Uncharacterised protein [uncultured archaeon]